MVKTTLLTLSLLASPAMPAGTADAGPKVTDKDFLASETHAQSERGSRQRQGAGWRKARASASRASDPSQAEPKDAPRWRYHGGSKLPPVYW